MFGHSVVNNPSLDDSASVEKSLLVVEITPFFGLDRLVDRLINEDPNTVKRLYSPDILLQM